MSCDPGVQFDSYQNKLERIVLQCIRQKTEGPMSAIAPRLPPKCTHCKAVQTTPEWSENAGESEVLYFWHCTACGHEFETRGCTVDRQLSKDELAEEFLPNLVVE